jgi:cyanophycinase-like exopeptidase
MFRFFLFFSVITVLIQPVNSQTYTSYIVGNTSDFITQAKGGICLMGGASEHDNAMRWFLQQANGGDILVLRTTGSDGYNDYMLNQLGVSVNSVETIVCHAPACALESYIQNKIAHAEAIWFAGGDQWDYITYWRNTPVDSLINAGIHERKLVIGGTSAGMAIQGGVYFSAQNGTITSQEALLNPFDLAMTVSTEPFILNDQLSNAITDTHYDNPDRKGRHVAFIARAYVDNALPVRGIACEEYTAVCIDTNGFCKIYGDYPTYDEDVYFIQPNCELTDNTPENCTIANPLTWNRSGKALKVYHAKGTQNGTQTFNLSNWNEGSGGVWEHWYVVDGQLYTESGTAPGCSLDLKEYDLGCCLDLPNPLSGIVNLKENVQEILVFDPKGSICLSQSGSFRLDSTRLRNGIYILQVSTAGGVYSRRIQIQN